MDKITLPAVKYPPNYFCPLENVEEAIDHPEDADGQAETFARNKAQEMLKDIELKSGDRMMLLHRLRKIFSEMQYEILTGKSA